MVMYMKHKKTLIPFLLIALFIGIFLLGRNPSPADSIFIVANPFDLNQIKSISRYRSCIGHDYSGKNIDGVLEENRSMKHYITQISSLWNTNDQIKVYAPFDGEMYESTRDQIDRKRGRQMWLEPDDARGWKFIFFHIDPLPELIDGGEVTAGQHIGYANVTDNAANFDIALKYFKFGQKFDSPFNHMSEGVLNEFANYGVIPQDIILSKEQRDAGRCRFELGSFNDKDFVILTLQQ